MSSHETFHPGDVVLQCGITLRGAVVAYRTYGSLSPRRNNVVVMPTPFGCRHTDIEQMLAPGRSIPTAGSSWSPTCWARGCRPRRATRRHRSTAPPSHR